MQGSVESMNGTAANGKHYRERNPRKPYRHIIIQIKAQYAYSNLSFQFSPYLYNTERLFSHIFLYITVQ